MTSKSHSGRPRLLQLVRTSSFGGLLPAIPRAVFLQTREPAPKLMSDIPLEPNPALELAETGATLDELAAAAEECKACPLYARATQVVFGAGPPTARVLMVGEQPGDQEDQTGEPFVGPAGGLLDRALARAGIERDQVFVTNVVKHFKWKPGTDSKPRLHAKPNRREVEACLPWFEAETRRVRPDLIVCLGATASKALLGRDFKVTQDHGLRFEWGGIPTVATIHPAAVLRAGSDRS